MDCIYSYSKLFCQTVFQSSLFFVICNVCYNAWETYILVSRKPVIIFCHSQVISQDPLGVRTPNYQNEPDNRNSAPLMKKEFFYCFVVTKSSLRGEMDHHNPKIHPDESSKKRYCLLHTQVGLRPAGYLLKTTVATGGFQI